MKKIIYLFCLLSLSCNSPKFFTELNKLRSNSQKDKIRKEESFGYLDLKLLKEKFVNTTHIFIYNKGRLINPNGMPSKFSKAFYIDTDNNKYYEVIRSSVDNKLVSFEAFELNKNHLLSQLINQYKIDKCNSLEKIIYKGGVYSLRHNEYFYEINLKNKIYKECNIKYKGI